MTADLTAGDLRVAAVDGSRALGRGAADGRTRRLVAALPRPHTVVRDHDDVAAVLTRLYAAAVRGRDVVHVVQLTAPGARDVAVELVTAGRLLGDAPAHHDLGDVPVRGPSVAGPIVIGLRTPRIDGAAIRALRWASAAVVVVDTAPGSERVLAEAADLLDGLDVTVVGLVVHQGRMPRAEA